VPSTSTSCPPLAGTSGGPNHTESYTARVTNIIMPPTVGKGAISVAFVHPSVCPFVCPSVAYIANNSRTQRPSVPKFWRKVPHLKLGNLPSNSHTRFKVKRSKVRVRGGQGRTVSAEPSGHTVFKRKIVLFNDVTRRPRSVFPATRIRIIFIARQHTDARHWYSTSVRPSVCLSVRLSIRP